MKRILMIISLLLIIATLVTACGSNIPYIGENGNWWVGDKDLEVPAQGPQGEKGVKGDTGGTGAPGASVKVESVKKTKTEATVDTYTIFFSDGTESSFTVKNGEDGQTVRITAVEKDGSDGLTDSYVIRFSDGTKQRFSVTNGDSISIQSIEKTGTQGLIDTYQICFSDGNVLTFTVTNGAEGLVPYIGQNGNWWVGDEDLGVSATSENPGAENMDGAGTDGLLFRPTIRGGIAGYEVYDYIGDETDIVIPNKIFNQPVVSIAYEDSLPSGITSLSISSNTQYLPLFDYRSSLKSFDFNHAPISIIADRMFYGCSSLKSITNYENVREVGEKAFQDSGLEEFDFSHITTIKAEAFVGCPLTDDEKRLYNLEPAFVYVPATVLEIGKNAFDSDVPIYYEGSTSTVISSLQQMCVKHTEDGYYYQDNGDGITILNYDGNQTHISIPKTIEAKQVTELGRLAFFGCSVVERVEIPSTVTHIGEYGFYGCRHLLSVFVPDSVLSFGTIEDDFWDEPDFETTTFFFESNTIDYSGGVISPDQLAIDKYMMGVKPSEIDEDEDCVFYKKVISYEVVTIKNVDGVATVRAKHNGMQVSRINSNALINNGRVTGVVIENGVSKISTDAFYGSSKLLFVKVPKSVEIVNYRGFHNLPNCIVYISSAVVPTDWDSSWNSQINRYILDSDIKISADGEFLYKIDNHHLWLVQYLKTVKANNLVIVPKTLDNIDVYGICSRCFSGNDSTASSSKRYVFIIPSSIEVVDTGAIMLNSYGYSYVCLEFESSNQIPSGWDSSWLQSTYWTNVSSYLVYRDGWVYQDGVLKVSGKEYTNH